MANEIIIKQGSENLKGSQQIFLRVNSILKKLGFEEVNLNSRIARDFYASELTLFIAPPRDYLNYRNLSIPQDLRTKYDEMKGYKSLSSIYPIISDEDKEKIEIDGMHMGDYYKNRNYVILFYPIYYTNFELGLKNEFLFYILDKFKAEIERIKPKLVDTSELMRLDLINKFLQEVKTSITGLNNKLSDYRASAEVKKRQALDYLSRASQTGEQVKVLRGTLKAMGNNINERIEEIKKLPFVKRVGISNLGIRVDFAHIDFEYEGNRLELGECYCYLNPNNLTIKNKNCVNYCGSTYHHPHVDNNSICFGTGKDKAYELLAEMKLKELVYFIYLFLKTYNEGDTYLSLGSWEKCKDNGGTWDDDDEDEESSSGHYAEGD